MRRINRQKEKIIRKKINRKKIKMMIIITNCLMPSKILLIRVTAFSKIRIGFART
jgi:hypothetical protein